MLTLWRLLRGGQLRGHRAKVLGFAVALSGLINAIAEWSVGDRSLLSLLQVLAERWATIAGGLGLVTLAAKIEHAQTPSESVEDIAGRALRR